MANLTFTFSPREAAIIADALSDMADTDLRYPENEITDLRDEIVKHPNFETKGGQ